MSEDKDAYYLALGRAIEHAAEALPEGYQVVIRVEKDAGAVELEMPHENIVSSDGEDLSDQVNWCVDFAIRGDATGTRTAGDGEVQS